MADTYEFPIKLDELPGTSHELVEVPMERADYLYELMKVATTNLLEGKENSINMASILKSVQYECQNENETRFCLMLYGHFKTTVDLEIRRHAAMKNQYVSKLREMLSKVSKEEAEVADENH